MRRVPASGSGGTSCLREGAPKVNPSGMFLSPAPSRRTFPSSSPAVALKSSAVLFTMVAEKDRVVVSTKGLSALATPLSTTSFSLPPNVAVLSNVSAYPRTRCSPGA